MKRRDFTTAITRPTGTVAMVALIALLSSPLARAYPIDAYGVTGIGRLEANRRIEAGEMDGRGQPAGALLPLDAVDIRFEDGPARDLPAADPELSARLTELLGDNAPRYGVSLLDLSDPQNPRYAEHQGEWRQNPGSVGKVLVALAIFQTLADLYPDDIEARRRILKETRIVADEFILTDSHTVRLWDRDEERLIRRPLKIGDTGTLYEFLDWMMSPSSNAAAATLMKHAVLMKHFGLEYPVDVARADAFLEQTDKATLRTLLAETMHTPVTRAGLDLDTLRQGSLFTRTGKARIPGTTSYGTPRELMRFAWFMEQGRLVDAFSSREIKRLLYTTERRIRYASSPALRDSAVYFKSGSLYRCRPEPDYECRKYMGNELNLLNSLAIVEHPAGERRLHYIVTVMSNVLYRNSAVDHQTLATRIQRLMTQRHPEQAEPEASGGPVVDAPPMSPEVEYGEVPIEAEGSDVESSP